MDSLVKFKRKKLRTRKSRNELRKRLYSNSEKDFTMHINSIDYLKDSQKYYSKNNCITTGRLTLAYERKAVRSETITRPALSEIKKLPALTANNTLNKNKTILQLSGTSIDNWENSYSSNGSVEVCGRRKSSDKSKENFRSSQSESPAEFSPHKSDTMTEISQPEEIESEFLENFLLTTSSLENSESGENHWKYECCVQNTPLYLDNTPALLNGYNDYEDNNFQCIQSNSEIFQTKYSQELSSMEVIKDDPMSYIKLGYIRQQAGATISSSFNSSLPILDTSNASPTFINNTPEYIYFPHKLNH